MRDQFTRSRITLFISLITFFPGQSTAQTSMTFDQAIQEGQTFGKAQPQGKDAANSLINHARNQGVPGFTPQAQSQAQTQGEFYLGNPGQMNPLGANALGTTEAGQWLQQSYNLRPRAVINPDDPITNLSRQAASGKLGCITQTVCTQPTSQVVSSSREVSCSVEYAQTPGQCSYALPQPTTVQGNGSGTLCVDHHFYARVYQENDTTYHLQMLDTSPAGSPHWNCGGPGSGGGVGDWHTAKIITLPSPPSSFSFCVTAKGAGCTAATSCASSPNKAVSVITCGAGGAQFPSYTYNYTFDIPAPPVSQETIYAACGAYMNNRCTMINELCSSETCNRSYVCTAPTKTDGCVPYRDQGCTLNSSACSSTDQDGLCLTENQTYTCTTETLQDGCAQESVQEICPESPDGIRCLNPSDCADTTSVPSQDLALAASIMQSLDAIEHDHANNPLMIFTGNSLGCRRSIASSITRNCCTLDAVLLGCSSSEKLLQTRRQKGQCVDAGSYCSQEVNLGFTNICVEQTTSFCCFSSKLTRIIQQQGRPQLGIGWGSPQNPNCRGFTPEELQRINFEKIDFSEYYSDITYVVPDNGQMSTQAQGSQALIPNPSGVPPPSDGISQGQVQQDINQFYGTHGP